MHRRVGNKPLVAGSPAQFLAASTPAFIHERLCSGGSTRGVISGQSVAGRTPGWSGPSSMNNKQASNRYTQLATMDIIAEYTEHVNFRQERMGIIGEKSNLRSAGWAVATAREVN